MAYISAYRLITTNNTPNATKPKPATSLRFNTSFK